MLATGIGQWSIRTSTGWDVLGFPEMAVLRQTVEPNVGWLRQGVLEVEQASAFQVCMLPCISARGSTMV
jgi:hypothetical protein